MLEVSIEMYHSLTKAYLECKDVKVVSGDVLSDKFAVENLLVYHDKDDEPKNIYWLGKEGQASSFVLDLGCDRKFNLIELVNTHNNKARDRGAKDIKVSISKTKTGPWEQVFNTTLEDSRNQTEPIPLQKFKINNNKTTHFIKVEVPTFFGKGGGLKYFKATYKTEDDIQAIKCDQVTAVSGEVFSKDYKVANMFTTSKDDEANKKLWIGIDNKPATVILNLGCEKTVSLIELINTHNSAAADSGTKDFTVSVAKEEKGPWQQVRDTTLEDPRNKK